MRPRYDSLDHLRTFNPPRVRKRQINTRLDSAPRAKDRHQDRRRRARQSPTYPEKRFAGTLDRNTITNAELRKGRVTSPEACPVLRKQGPTSATAKTKIHAIVAAASF